MCERFVMKLAEEKQRRNILIQDQAAFANCPCKKGQICLLITISTLGVVTRGLVNIKDQDTNL